MSKRVLVLGASGFIGKKIVRRLASEEGWRPVAASRHPPQDTGIESLRLDTLDAAALAQALQGVDSVVNCVAGDEHTIREGARALVQACKQARPRRLVHLSTMSVYGSATGVVGEDAPLSKEAGWYGAAKFDAEAAVQDYVSNGGDAVILRPGCVYGPGSEQWVGRIGRLLQAGRLGDLGAAGDGYSNLVHVDDVANAILAALEAPALQHVCYNLAAPDSPTWNGYFVRLAKAIGATPVRRISRRQLTLDAKALSIGLKVAEIAFGKLGRHPAWLPDPLPPSLVRLWGQDIVLSPARASAELLNRWTSLDDGVRNSAAWFASR